MATIQISKNRATETLNRTAITQKQSIDVVQTMLHGGVSTRMSCVLPCADGCPVELHHISTVSDTLPYIQPVPLTNSDRFSLRGHTITWCTTQAQRFSRMRTMLAASLSRDARTQKAGVRRLRFYAEDVVRGWIGFLTGS
jgi:hypothetical protein